MPAAKKTMRKQSNNNPEQSPWEPDPTERRKATTFYCLQIVAESALRVIARRPEADEAIQGST